MAVPKELIEQQVRYTVEEYLTLERESEERHEYVDGVIYAMAGESPEHADVSANLSGLVVTQLSDGPCRARIKDTKVRSGPLPLNPRKKKGLFSYPDLLVICGEPEYLDKRRQVVTNPTVIFEILSDSTETRDRGVKFDRYRDWNPTLSDYLLVWQTEPMIEHFTRQPDDSWNLRIYKGLEQSLTIGSLACTLRLAEVYNRVEFPPAEDELAEDAEAPEEAGD